MLQFCRCCTYLAIPLARGLGYRGQNGYPLVIALEFGMRRNMEQALFTESFVIKWRHLRK